MLIALTLLGCLNPYGGDDTDGGSSGVGPDGGEVVLDDVRVVIPPGALDEVITLRIVDTGELPPAPYVGLSNVFAFEPADYALAGPIQVEIPFAPAEADARFWQSDGAGAWTALPHTIADGRIVGEVSVLRPVFVAERPLSVLEVAGPYPPADVLVVVDNSCSMSAFQSQLSAQMGALLPGLLDSGLDVHVGVTTTDTFTTGPGNKGTLRPVAGERFITPTTPDAESIFASMVNAGTAGHYDETGRAAAYTLIELKWDVPANVDFYRPEGTLHVVFVSDEEDLSTPDPVTRAEFIEWALDLKTFPQDVVMNGVFYIPGTVCQQAFEPAGTAYNAYVDQTGGEKVSICAADWSVGLEAMVDRVLATARVTLPEDPTEPPEVTLVDGASERLLDPSEYTWDAASRTVFFDLATRPTPTELVRLRWLPVELP